jgi:hypothetical protein
MPRCNCGGCIDCLSEQISARYLDQQTKIFSNAGTVGIGNIEDLKLQSSLEISDEYIEQLAEEDAVASAKEKGLQLY